MKYEHYSYIATRRVSAGSVCTSGNGGAPVISFSESVRKRVKLPFELQPKRSEKNSVIFELGFQFSL